MSDALKQKLQKYEEVPPASVWNGIASQLNEEFSPADIRLAQRMDDVSIAPPAQVWGNISKDLSVTGDKDTDSPQAKILPMWIRRAAVAAVIILVLGVGAFYLFQPPTNQSKPATELSSVISPVPAPRIDTQSTPPAATSIDTPQANTRTLIASNDRPLPRKQFVRSRRTSPSSPTQYAYDSPLDYTINEAHVSTPVIVNAMQPVSVSAPPIRDSRGNIILDLDVISKPGQQYITVTGPNGNQTRISNKFIDCLRYLNSNVNAAEWDRNAVDCRAKFDQWRDKILSEAAFMPSADNFFDIFELKEMIED